MNRRFLGQLALTLFSAVVAFTSVAHAADEAPEALIKRLSSDVLEAIKADKDMRSGDIAKIVTLVDGKIMPHVNFERMTASAVGPGWRKASPAQQKRLQEEFKILLVRTYSGALSQVSDQTIFIKRTRAGKDDAELLIRSEVRGTGDPLQLDYRLEKTPGEGAGWKIYNLNVLGVWLVETYRSQFAQEINAGGVDGLIAKLAERNKLNASKG